MATLNITENKTTFVVRSSNFDWHSPIPCETYPAALQAAKARGFEAHIYREQGEACELVATWSALYGAKVYNYELIS